MKFLLAGLSLLASFAASSQVADWSREATLPGQERLSPQHRANILGLSEADWAQARTRGQRHVMVYPVEVTELTIPYRAFTEFFDSTGQAPVRRWISLLLRQTFDVKSPEDVMAWLGLHPFEESDPTPVSAQERALGMGATVADFHGAEGLTFSCAACHSASLFGKPVVGLTNRFPRANEFFAGGKNLAPLVDPGLFQRMTGATRAERELLERSLNAIRYVGAKRPATLGLDTSLAQVALSLSRRAEDEYATRLPEHARRPRPNALATEVADSKPAVWWNLKYKTRWLSDGSIVQGNPILTNFLWNEIGRGVDLRRLEGWMLANQPLINDLTARVFATEAPAYLDFLPEETLDLAMAKRGQAHFNNHCLRCHGRYDKAWEQDGAAGLPLKEQVRTLRVHYHRRTPVIDVGTDPGRWKGMQHFAGRLNQLKISRSIQTVVEPQRGYVPPPLVGIWARWPYFHNNSVPSLCAVLTKASARPRSYVAGPAVDPQTDFDADCVGYPVNAPAAWRREADYRYDTTKEGLSNAGHDEGIFLREGRELMTPVQKRELVEFLKTL